MLDRLMDGRLLWLEEVGVGYFPVVADPNVVYDKDYWDRYCEYRGTDVGKKLTDCRVDLVKKYLGPTESCVDVGIGNGDFVLAMNCLGTDINPHAVEWLKSQNRYVKLRNLTVDALTLWDVLEHIEDPTSLLERSRKYAFVSTPIYNNVEHVLRSKHYRKDEHFWYFTKAGLCAMMSKFGFECIYDDTRETEHGREDIGSFVFKRMGVDK